MPDLIDIRDLLVEQIPYLRRYARSLTGNSDLADDIVQECLIRAIRKQDYFQRGTNLRAWLFTIMHNLYLDIVRKDATGRARAALRGPGEQQTVAQPTQELSLDLKLLENALNQLPGDQKSALLLVALEGMNYQETAKITGVAVGTVKSRVSRARETLRHLMQPTDPGSPPSTTPSARPSGTR